MLEWDSDFFGFTVARVERDRLTGEEAASALAWCRARGVRCLYFLCAPDDDESVRAAEAGGFHFVDIRVDLDWRVPPGAVVAPLGDEAASLGGEAAPPGVRPLYDAECDELIEIAAGAYADSRFYYDRNFTPERASALFREWARKSCAGYADAVLVCEREGGRVGGFVTCHAETPGVGRIGLTGVHTEARGTGAGRKLVRAAQGYFAARGVAEVRVATQGRNVAAQRLYQRCGFRTRSVGLWYHRWF
jgi:dTDP-4-amino-4,6-dideoxy-D-galactose acyltransferase